MFPSGAITSQEIDGLGRVKEHIVKRTVGGVTTKVCGEHYSYVPAVVNASFRETNRLFANIENYNGSEYSTEYRYDANQNINEIYEAQFSNRHRYYRYDALNRLLREDNEELGKTSLFEYDKNGNRLKRREYAFTTASVPAGEKIVTSYTYSTTRKDCLERVRSVRASDGAVLSEFSASNYDSGGNPKTWNGNALEWIRGGLLKKYGAQEFVYNAEGVRIESRKNGATSRTFDVEGTTIHREVRNGQTLWYYYDMTGPIAVEYQYLTYYYQKSAQGDVTRIVDPYGNIVARYVYDAWGNHKIYNALGIDITNDSSYNGNIGKMNPFRYRGYYYDDSLGMYHLVSRYYDPKIGRFLSADSSDYLDPYTLGGMNLFAYCLNNPIYFVDSAGAFAVKNKGTRGKTGIQQHIPSFYDENNEPLSYEKLQKMLKSLPDTKEGRAFGQKIKMQQKWLKDGRHHGEHTMSYVTLPRWQERFSFVNLPRWQESFSTAKFPSYPEGFSVVNFPQYQESFNIENFPRWQESFYFGNTNTGNLQYNLSTSILIGGVIIVAGIVLLFIFVPWATPVLALV